jgi:hypothetical protein
LYWSRASRPPESVWLQDDSHRNRQAICPQTSSSCVQASTLYTDFKADPVNLPVHCPDGLADTGPGITPDLGQSTPDMVFHTDCTSNTSTVSPYSRSSRFSIYALVYTHKKSKPEVPRPSIFVISGSHFVCLVVRHHYPTATV